VVFVGYGMFAAAIRDRVISRPRVLAWMLRTFAAAFAGARCEARAGGVVRASALEKVSMIAAQPALT
jgi:hypothetical protein